MKNRLILLITTFLLLFSINSQATHFHGGEISYTCLGNNQYEIFMTIYTDCSSVGFGGSPIIEFTSSTCANFFDTLTQITNSPVEISQTCLSAITNCNVPSTGVSGMEKYIHSGIVTLPGNCSDWIVSLSACCRNCSASNLVNSCSENYYIYTKIDATTSSCNNSPVFTDNTPSIWTCIDDTLHLNFNATDVDGDSLVYSLINAQNGPNSSVAYGTSLSGQNPFVGTTTINSRTGAVRVITNIVQTTYINVLVEEYRNGIKIGEVHRDILTYIGICNTNNNSSPRIRTMNGINTNNASFTYTVPAYSLLTLNLDVFDADVAAGNQTLSVAWKNLPASALTLSGTFSVFSWSPTAADVGSHFITVHVKDDFCPYVARNSYVFEMIVPPVNAPPIANDDYYTVHSNHLLTENILENDTDPEGNQLNLTNVAVQPSNGTILTLMNNQVEYLPNPGFVGIDSFVYQICDNGTPPQCSQGTVYITVDYEYHTTLDTITLSTTTDVCFYTSNLTSNLVSATLQTDSFQYATILNTDLAAGCIKIQADSIALDSAVYLICDNVGNCVYNQLNLDIQEIVLNLNQLDLNQFIKVFPNPVSNILNIQSEDLIIEQITLTSISGQLIQTKTINNYLGEMNVQHLPNGIYTLSIMTNKGLIHKKINVLK